MHSAQQIDRRADELALSDPLPSTADAEVQKIVLASPAVPRANKELSRLATELGLSAFVQTTDTLKSELQKIVVGLHPDKTGGEFKSDHDKTRFMKARRAVELLNGGGAGDDAGGGGTRFPGAVHALGDASASRAPRDAARELQISSMADARERIARYFAAPRIGCAATAAVLLLLVTLSDRLEQNAVFGPWLADPGFVWFLTAVASATAAGALALWICEGSARSRAEHLMSEAALGEIFEQARRCARRCGRAGQLSAFDIRHAVRALIQGPRNGGRGWSPSRALDQATLESISAVQTQRLLDRKVIRLLDTPSIEVLYEVSPLAAHA
jgi:hypothetical protein